MKSTDEHLIEPSNYRSLFQFRIADIAWLTLWVGVMCGWWYDHKEFVKLTKEVIAQRNHQQEQATYWERSAKFWRTEYIKSVENFDKYRQLKEWPDWSWEKGLQK
jgi:hypothetical protein